MKQLLNRLIEFDTLNKDEAYDVLTRIGQGEYNPTQISAFLTVYMMRIITVNELEGFRDAMLELCLPFDINGLPAMDVCGTGGDGKDTFNISTTTAFVVAGAGQPVVKHGNYGVSSLCGSSTVMEFLGLKFTNNTSKLQRQLDKAGICFLHAPLFHPAMKLVGPIRKELGLKTFFNMLGPLVNPARPQLQLAGVFNLELARMYGYLFQQQPKVQFSIVHDLGGYDEISLTGSAKNVNNQGERILNPEFFGLKKLSYEEIASGNSVESAAKILTDILKGKGDKAKTDVVIANASLALQVSRPNENVADLMSVARESIASGNAWKSFNALMETE